MSKQRGANRTRNKRDSKGRQRLQRGRRRIALREENVREDDDRRGGVNVKVEELDGGANQRGDDNFIARIYRNVFRL